MENKIKIDYPQKINLWIEFPYEIVAIHNDFDYLEDKWDDIVHIILHSFQDNQLNVISHNTEFDEHFTTITCYLTFIAQPPIFETDFLSKAIMDEDETLQFTLKTNDEYNKDEFKILYKTPLNRKMN